MGPTAFSTVPASHAGFSPTILAELDGYYDALVAGGALAGHVMLLARGHDIAHAHVTGYLDWDTKQPLHPDTIFSLFSMSKPLTAVAMLLLYDEGRWQMDDPVSIHLPEFKSIAELPGSRATRPPTIRETFTHTAGYSFGITREEMTKRMRQIAWHEAGSLFELMARYAAIPLDYEPGTSWEYSGATDLQAAIVERLTGERFDRFLERRLFAPLGMRDTGFALSPSQSRRLAPCLMVDEETGRLRPARSDERMESIFPMGGTSFKSTALDFALFARMLLNRGSLGDARVLAPGSVDLMLSDQRPDAIKLRSFRDGHYVIGGGNGHGLNGLVCIDPQRAGRPVGRGSYEWGGAFGTWFWIDPTYDILCVGMTNRRRNANDMRPLETVAQDLIYRALKA